MRERNLIRKPYPTRNALPVHPEELGFESDYDLYQENHHLAFTRREMSRFAITQTFRDLNSMQVPLPKAPHSELHRLYLPPQIGLKEAYEYVWQAYEHTEQLRYGSIRSVHYSDIEASRMERVEREYQDIKHLL